MKKSEKNFLIGTLVFSMIGASAGTVYSTDVIDVIKRDVNNLKSSVTSGVHYYVPSGYKYSDFDFNGTYYVHRNDERTIVSTSPSVDGYECLGTYESTSSSEVLFYVAYSSRENSSIIYEAISYDDLEKENNIFKFVGDLALIDENSPEELSAFVPDNSIKPIDQAKTFTQKF